MQRALVTPLGMLLALRVLQGMASGPLLSQTLLLVIWIASMQIMLDAVDTVA